MGIKNTDNNLPIIGSTELISIGKRAIDVPAKIDTGADSSSIWASHIRVGKDGVLRFRLFGEGSKYYSGKVFKRIDFSVSNVKNSTGHTEIRYRTKFPVVIGGKRIRISMNLSDRSRNTFKVLIGRRSIAGKFLVDVNKRAVPYGPSVITKGLRKKLSEDPYKFHKKYVKVDKH